MEAVAKQGGSERKNLRTLNRERVRMMHENNKTRADSTVVHNFLGKCCPEQTRTQSLLRLRRMLVNASEGGHERVSVHGADPLPLLLQTLRAIELYQ